MKEFNDSSLPEQIARDRYLLDQPQQAMEKLLCDVDELVSMAKIYSDKKFNETTFDELLTIVEAGTRGLLKLAFNPEENKFFVQVFRRRVRKALEPPIYDLPECFRLRLNQIAYLYHSPSRLKVMKPQLGMKKYIAGIATAVSAILSVAVFVPMKNFRSKTTNSSAADFSDSDLSRPIEVVLPSLDVTKTFADRSFESPFVASTLEKTMQKDQESIELRQKRSAAFLQKTKEDLSNNRVQYQQYFSLRESIIGNALPQNVVSADTNFRRLVMQLRPKVSGLSVKQYLEVIAPYITSPVAKNDNRNNRSYFTDLFNDVVRDKNARHDSYAGNCEARTSAYLALTQRLRPDLLANSFVQIFKGHVRFGMKDGEKMYGVDGEVKKLQPRHVSGTALATPEEFFVHPLLTGQPYQASKHVQGSKYHTRYVSPKTDSLLPGAESDNLKSFDDERTEDLVDTGIKLDEAKKIVEKHRLGGGCDSPDDSSQCFIGKPDDDTTEEQFIHKLEESPDNYAVVDLKKMPLTPKLAHALSRLHFLTRLKINESGLIPDMPSPLLTLVGDPTSADYVISPSDLLADLLRKTSSLTVLRLPKLRYASNILKTRIKKLPVLEKFSVPQSVANEFSGVVEPEILHTPLNDFLSTFSMRYSEQLSYFAKLGISSKEAPSWEMIESWLKNLPPQAIDEISNFEEPMLILVPPVKGSVLLKDIPHIIRWPRGWNIHQDSWGFGITDGADDMPKDSRINYTLSAAEVLKQYTDLYKPKNMEILSQMSYLSFLAVRNSLTSTPVDIGTITVFPRIADGVPVADWRDGRVFMDGFAPGDAYYDLRGRPWVQGKNNAVQRKNEK